MSTAIAGYQNDDKKVTHYGVLKKCTNVLVQGPIVLFVPAPHAGKKLCQLGLGLFVGDVGVMVGPSPCGYSIISSNVASGYVNAPFW
jgi:hypothetical protein